MTPDRPRMEVCGYGVTRLRTLPTCTGAKWGKSPFLVLRFFLKEADASDSVTSSLTSVPSHVRTVVINFDLRNLDLLEAAPVSAVEATLDREAIDIELDKSP